MIIRRFTFTALTFFIFIFALYRDGMLFHDKIVPRETPTFAKMNIVHSGVSQNKKISIEEISIIPRVSVGQKIANHSRTLRAHFSNDAAMGGLGLYIESASPFGYYRISGDFVLTTEYPALSWSDDQTLQFFGHSEDGALLRITLNTANQEAVFEQLEISL